MSTRPTTRPTTRSTPRLLTVLLAAALAAAATAFAPAPTPTTDVRTGSAAVDPDPDRWAPADEATIFPSVTTSSDTGSCTSNFVFEEFVEVEQPDGTIEVRRDLYLGTAAHCVGLGTNTDTNGCTTGSLELDSPVEVDGASEPATLAYSAWATMIEQGEPTDSDQCAYNDFALLLLDPADHDAVNPSLPFFGGPTAVGGATSQGDEVYSVGNSSLRLGIQQLGPKVEVSMGMFYSPWQHLLYAVSPGIPGDSGSGHVNASGEAMGISSTLYAAPFAGANGVTDLQMSLEYLRQHTDLDPQLAVGTEPFSPLLP